MNNLKTTFFVQDTKSDRKLAELAEDTIELERDGWDGSYRPVCYD